MKRLRRYLVAGACLVVVAGAGLALAQRGRRNRDVEIGDRNGVPTWEVDDEFPEDVFTFARIKYSQWGGRGGRWATDYPDSDLNLSFRLQQLTSMKVHPDGRVIELTEADLHAYPFIYLIEPGGLEFSEDEVRALRRYLMSGGFLMVDDFWGEAEWENFYQQIKRVFPDREPVELPITHPIFSAVFPLKEKPQVPSINYAIRGRSQGITWEREDAKEVHYKAFFDDKGRMVAIICHNTDLGDGWEREGEDAWYFKEFSEKKAYPIGINILFYAMTH